MPKVVVLEKFKKNWEIGSVIRDLYARNYLIPTVRQNLLHKKILKSLKI